MARTIESVYLSYRRARNIVHSMPFRAPKDFEKWFNEKLNDKNREILKTITNKFNTQWNTIDPLEYFICGYKVFGTGFAYNRFFEKNIITLYIERDKVKAYSSDAFIKNVTRALIFVEKHAKISNYTPKISMLKQYSLDPAIPLHMKEGYINVELLTLLKYYGYNVKVEGKEMSVTNMYHGLLELETKEYMKKFLEETKEKRV